MPPLILKQRHAFSAVSPKDILPIKLLPALGTSISAQSTKMIVAGWTDESFKRNGLIPINGQAALMAYRIGAFAKICPAARAIHLEWNFVPSRQRRA